jgi:hypothetical protein
VFNRYFFCGHIWTSSLVYFDFSVFRAPHWGVWAPLKYPTYVSLLVSVSLKDFADIRILTSHFSEYLIRKSLSFYCLSNLQWCQSVSFISPLGVPRGKRLCSAWSQYQPLHRCVSVSLHLKALVDELLYQLVWSASLKCFNINPFELPGGKVLTQCVCKCPRLVFYLAGFSWQQSTRGILRVNRHINPKCISSRGIRPSHKLSCVVPTRHIKWILDREVVLNGFSDCWHVFISEIMQWVVIRTGIEGLTLKLIE